MATILGHASSDTRRPRNPILTVGASRGQNCSIGSEQPDTTENEHAAQRFHDWLWQQRNEWDIGRRGLGLIGSGGRIRKCDAEHELRKAIKALAREGTI